MNGDAETEDPAPKTTRVIAKYNFEGRNNDELTFQKNDVFEVTQMVEGGWWEGVINNVVGWFPSDFVGVIKTQSNGKTNGTRLSNTEVDEALEKTRLKFRHEILSGVDGFMKKENEHIEKLMRFPTDFFPAIHEQQVLTSNEFRTISINILQIIDTKKALFDELESELKKDVVRQEIGSIFLKYAINFKDLLFAYCANHPLAMALIVKKREVIERALKVKDIDFKEFITALSLVFRHTEKYASILQEVERNTQNLHLDRGNLQRACLVYRDIAEDCLAIRKQKEMQLEFLNSGSLEKVFGRSYEQKIGPIVYVASVTLQMPNNDDETDRCFALFRNSCLLFEVASGEKTAFVLNEQFPTPNLKIRCNDNLMQVEFLKDSKPVFSINSLTLDDYRRLCNALREFPFEEIPTSDNVYNIQEVPSIAAQKVEPEQMASSSPTKHIEFSNLPQSKKAISQPKNFTKTGGITLNHQVEMILPDGLGEYSAQKPPVVPGSGGRAPRHAKLYSGWCLRPSSVSGSSSGGLQSTASSSSIKLRKGLTIEEQEDAYLLKIVEGYCAPSNNGLSGSFSRMNISTTSNYPLPRRATSYPEDIRPQLIMANDEKIFVEELEGNELVLKEKSLVDTVYELKDQVLVLQKELDKMKQSVSHEQKARRRLEEAFRRLSNNYSHSSTPKPTEDSINP